jgi:DNA-directed RNA polymerase specialized sigma24 family protein
VDGTFEEYVAARGDRLLRFAFLLCGDRHLAEDLVQEMLARIHHRWHCMTDVEQPDAYLRAAILRQFRSWRRQQSSRETSLELLPEPAAGTPDAAARHAARDEMWWLLATLPRKQRVEPGGHAPARRIPRRHRSR